MTPPTHGNYRGYYSKRPFINDPRLALLDPRIFADAIVLDVGCNEGWVTCEIAQQWHAKRVVGVDIDPELILAAWRRRRTVWSIQKPFGAGLHSPATLKRKRHDADSDCAAVVQLDNFPLALVHMYGPLPIPSGGSATQSVFPHNLAFRTADWVADGIPEDAAGYDVVLALSISKWIHLNSGDTGLLTFFRRVASVLRPGGTFVFEPQAWDTYAKARRMDTKLRDMASTIELRPELFPGIIEEIGFGPCEHMGMTGEGGFHRPVDVYVKR